MALTPAYVDGASGMQVGVASAEDGIKVESVSQRWENPKAQSFDNIGTVDGFAQNFNPSTTVTVSGEVTTLTASLLPDTSGTGAATIANTTDTSGGITVSDYYIDDWEITQSRAPNFKSFTGNYSAHPEVATP